VQETSGLPPTMLNEPGPPISDEELGLLVGKVEDIAPRSQIVVFGGSIPTGVPADIYRKLVRIVREAGARAILDSDGEPMRLGLAAVPFMIKPNRDEVRRLLGLEIKSLNDSARAVGLFRNMGVEIAVISMGSDGAVAGSSEGAWHAIPPKVRPVSTIGSGDSMIAGIAHVLCGGGSFDEALRWGTAAGAATAMTNGAEICRRGQVVELLDRVKLSRIG
jgi:1-phosphofructokinase family hexose kinase